MSITFLSICLVVMLVLATFFSAAETGMMAINRYRLRHLAVVKKHRGAKRVEKMLERPEQVLGVVLIGNTCANIFASSLETTIVLKMQGDYLAIVATGVLTLFILIFCEVAPKTFAALYPEPVAFFVSLPLRFLQITLFPVIWFVNGAVAVILKLLRVRAGVNHQHQLSVDELRSVVYESSAKIPVKHKDMLLGILDLNQVSVNDIMVPRNEITGIDLDQDIEDIIDQLSSSQHTRLPVFSKQLEDVHGLLHVRDALSLLIQEKLSKDAILSIVQPANFVPEQILLSKQLFNFQREKYRTGLVIDEYGNILGLVTLEDILEEIIGEFTTDFASLSKEIHAQTDQSYVVDASIAVRKLNRVMGWKFSVGGPKTLSGLIIEYLRMLPRAGTCVRLDGYPIEIIKVQDNMIKTIRIFPHWRKESEHEVSEPLSTHLGD